MLPFCSTLPGSGTSSVGGSSPESLMGNTTAPNDERWFGDPEHVTLLYGGAGPVRALLGGSPLSPLARLGREID